jgi:hypothetical protein
LTQLQRGSSAIFTWQPADGVKPAVWLLQTQARGVWQAEVLPGMRLAYSFTNDAPQVISVRAVDRNGTLGIPCTMSLAQPQQYTSGPTPKPKGKSRKLATPKHND